MSRRAGFPWLAALVLAAACQPSPPRRIEPQPGARTPAERALADSLERMVERVLAGFEQPDYRAIMGHYERGLGPAWAENGMIYQTFEELDASAHRMGAGVVVHARLGERHVIVFGPDVAVMTAIIEGTTTDSAGLASPFSEAWTLVFHRTGEGWRVAASHESFPHECPGSPRPREPGR